MERPRLGFWQIWNMSFGFFGIQFGWDLQMANMSAIYQYLGAEESDIAFSINVTVEPFRAFVGDLLPNELR
ncbi:MAG TPA: hypothetical protein VEC99_18395, partial [Clostridia bacterium]|nr:hypothetical protein [Clostridia bacterium]